MAMRYFGLNRGQREFDTTEGAATGSTDIEVRIDLTKSFTQAEVQQKLQELKNFILMNYSTNAPS